MPNFATTRIAALAVGLTVGALTAGCSSAPTTAHDLGPAGTVVASTTTTSTTTPRVTPKQAALALARRMVDEVVLPPGTVPSKAPLPKLLRGPWELPAGGNIVGTNRVWTIAEEPSAVLAFLTTHVPSGFQSRGTGTSSSPTEKAQYVVEPLQGFPPNVSEAGLEIGVAAGTAGNSLVNVYGGVQWTEPRPADEHVPADDAVVIVSVIRAFQPGKPVVRRVVVTDPAKVADIARAFDAVPVAPPGWVSGCYELTSNTVSYRIEFATSPTATPDLVASAAPCSPLAVTVHGRPRPALSASYGAFGHAVAHALGKSELNFE